MAMIYATGTLSGAHINPAVCLTFVVTGRFTLSEAWPYITAHWISLVGPIGAAILAALLCRWIQGPECCRNDVGSKEART